MVVPAGPRSVEADPAVAVLPEVDDVAARRHLGDRHGGELLDAADRRTARCAQLGVAVVDDPRRRPSRSVGAGFGPAGTRRRWSCTSPAIRSAARMWLGVDRHDSSVPNDHSSPGASVDVQLGEERGRGAVGVDLTG